MPVDLTPALVESGKERILLANVDGSVIIAAHGGDTMVSTDSQHILLAA